MVLLTFFASFIFCSVRQSLSDLIRTQREATVEIHLDAAGDVMDMGSLRYGPDVAGSEVVKSKVVGADGDILDEVEGNCNYDFPLGMIDSNNCAGNEKVLDMSDCSLAAAMANVTAWPTAFTLDKEWQYHHPVGCFAYPCHQSKNAASVGHGTANTICYYYNGIGGEDQLINITGTPVCRRMRYKLGQNASMKCPSGYHLIEDRTTGGQGQSRCRIASHCISKVTANEFRVNVLQQSQYNFYPKGCFEAPHQEGVADTVYYNQEQSGIGDPAGPTLSGRPLCMANATEFGSAAHPVIVTNASVID